MTPVGDSGKLEPVGHLCRCSFLLVRIYCYRTTPTADCTSASLTSNEGEKVGEGHPIIHTRQHSMHRLHVFFLFCFFFDDRVKPG